MTCVRSQEQHLREIVRANAWLMEVLVAVRDQRLPEWVVGAGVVRNVVWDHFHGYATPTPPNDVDVAYFDPTELSRAKDKDVEQALRERIPSVPWEVHNQAAVHLWYEAKFGFPFPPAQSIDDAVSRWPETATSVGVRLRDDGRLQVFAPVGLEDLLALVLRRNPRQVPPELFRERLRQKRIRERWPLVRVVDE
jgi:uncharacterized protein